MCIISGGTLFFQKAIEFIYLQNSWFELLLQQCLAYHHLRWCCVIVVSVIVVDKGVFKSIKNCYNSVKECVYKPFDFFLSCVRHTRACQRLCLQTIWCFLSCVRHTRACQRLCLQTIWFFLSCVRHTRACQSLCLQTIWFFLSCVRHTRACQRLCLQTIWFFLSCVRHTRAVRLVDACTAKALM